MVTPVAMIQALKALSFQCPRAPSASIITRVNLCVNAFLLRRVEDTNWISGNNTEPNTRSASSLKRIAVCRSIFIQRKASSDRK
jgi:hypothetical protein